jgi:hypothetical protein
MTRSTLLLAFVLLAFAACGPAPTEPARPAVPASAAFNGETPPPPPPDTTGRGGGSLGSGT